VNRAGRSNRLYSKAVRWIICCDTGLSQCWQQGADFLCPKMWHCRMPFKPLGPTPSCKRIGSWGLRARSLNASRLGCLTDSETAAFSSTSPCAKRDDSAMLVEKFLTRFTQREGVSRSGYVFTTTDTGPEGGTCSCAPGLSKAVLRYRHGDATSRGTDGQV
jgi:hypothetical protein